MTLFTSLLCVAAKRLYKPFEISPKPGEFSRLETWTMVWIHHAERTNTLQRIRRRDPKRSLRWATNVQRSASKALNQSHYRCTIITGLRPAVWFIRSLCTLRWALQFWLRKIEFIDSNPILSSSSRALTMDYLLFFRNWSELMRSLSWKML